MFLEEKTQGEAVPVKVGTLKLSEAIRIGIRRYPFHCRALFFNGHTGACALGAAVFAKEGRETLSFDTNWDRYFGTPYGMASEVVQKNDSGWSREQIADWLESQGY